MKAEKSSIYREIENLILWFIPIGNKIPKDFALRTVGERMLNELIDALTSCNLALRTKDLNERLDFISLVKLHITTVQGLSKVLVEYSSREGNTTRIISYKQRAALLTSMTNICSQISKWMASTQKAALQHKALD